MKRVPCSGPGACKSQWCRETADYVPIKREVEVLDDYTGYDVFCSLECAAYAGYKFVRLSDITHRPGDEGVYLDSF